MRNIEESISILIENQFPSFYKTDGRNFIAFVKAYYEWLENNFQELVFENSENFNVGDILTQGTVTGTIISKDDNENYLVQIDIFDNFKCGTFCNDLQIATSSSGGSSLIVIQKRYNTQYLSRNLFNYKDIDTTIDKFIISFKEKYLPNIQFNTTSNKKLFIKNSLDFYRSKGTPRAVDLFFKLIYGLEARVYYPGDDIFKSSDNEWADIKYLELEYNPDNVQFVGQQIVGTISDAEATVSRLVKIKKGYKTIHVAYLSGLVGNFVTGENIATYQLQRNVTTRVIGSLSQVDILSSPSGFKVGDVVFAKTGQGKNAKARVADIESRTGLVNFKLIDGGWGYDANTAEVIGSDKVILIDNIDFENTQYLYINNPIKQFEELKQNLIQLEYTDTTNTNIFSLGESVTAYDSNDDIIFEGSIVNLIENTNVSGKLIIDYNPSTYSNTTAIESVDTIYLQANVEYANIANVNATQATANLIAVGNTLSIEYTSNGTFNVGDVLYQTANINGRSIQYANASVLSTNEFIENNTFIINLERGEGYFRTDMPVYRKSDDEALTINRMFNIRAGIVEINDTLQIGANTITSITNTEFTFSSRFGYDTAASFILTRFNNEETIQNFYTDSLISEIASNTIIDSSDYSVANVAIGFTDLISDAFVFEDKTLSTIQAIVVSDPGNAYSADPFFIVYEPSVKHLERYDYKIVYDGEEKNFIAGEYIEGQTSGTIGFIRNNDRIAKTLSITRITTNGVFRKGEIFTGLSTNTSAEIISIEENRKGSKTGLNAVIESIASSGNGFVTELELLSSGFGYIQGDNINFSKLNTDNDITTIGWLGTQGSGEGYYTSKKGFLSSDKFLHDNDFYQEYSYQVLTALPFEIYKKTLIDVLHVSGTKPFGAYVSTQRNDINIKSNTESIITLS
jgi:hypothetical protein